LAKTVNKSLINFLSKILGLDKHSASLRGRGYNPEDPSDLQKARGTNYALSFVAVGKFFFFFYPPQLVA
jgi:hypothetical protein